MIMPSDAPQPDLLLTGSTGFVGHQLLANLLRQGRRCGVLLRAPLLDSLARLEKLLTDLDIDFHCAIASQQLVPIEGDLSAGTPCIGSLRIGTIIHAAASTLFDRDSVNEPWRTNVEGTSRLLSWAEQWNVRNLHHVSTAYSSGRHKGTVPEAMHDGPRSFRNAYEHSKWEAERLCRAWADSTGSTLTIHRPSVVVGAYETGRASKFDGLYLSARATEVFSRMYDANDPARYALSLRLRGRAEECQNLVSVDYVAAMIAAAVARPAMQGRIYHLVHPNPPTNQRISDSLNHHFNVAGSHWVAPECFDEMVLTEHERIFNEFSKPIAHYFVDTPRFARSNAEDLEGVADLRCGDFDQAAISRLMRFAQDCQWGKKKRKSRKGVSSCAAYFEEFLPNNVSKSNVARLTGLSVIVRFIIEDERNGQWVCRFDRGKLAEVHRGSNSLHEDFGYRLGSEAFWRAVSGKVHPQLAFLTGEVQVFGDVERALKMAMILHAFNQEFPFEQGGQRCLQHAS